MGSVVRNFGVTKKLFASTTVLAEKQDPADPQKPLDSSKKIKSAKFSCIAQHNVLIDYF